jgi:multidrug efflux pump subunit AcrA (membrane-fusion protein)
MTPTALSRLTSIVVGAVLALALCFAPAASAQAEAEPNDDYETATGPLAPNTTYTGLLDSDADVDIYFFYVTSAASEIHLTISDPTVGGGGVYAELEDSEGEEIAPVDVPAEDFGTLEATLDPGIYYLWVEMEEYEVFDEAYEITTSGAGAGSFSSPAQAQAQCKAATAAATKAQAALDKAKRRLKQARKSDSRERKAKAQHAVKLAKAKLKAASAEQKLLCSIPL